MNRGILAVVISVICSGVYAQSAAPSSNNIIRLDMITAAGNKFYDITPTEQTGAYTAQAATVGTKAPANLRDIPQSVSIITQQSMQDRNVHTLDELAKQTAGLRVLANDSGRSSIYARGYEYDEYSADGLPAQMESINGNLPNLAAFDRVEIMRGPSGLFNSTTEMGGVVNLVRKRPSGAFQGSVTAGISYPFGYNLTADAGGSLNADRSLKGRVIAQGIGRRNQNAKHNNHSETLYSAVDWDIGTGSTLGLGYLYQQRHIKPDNGLPLDGKNLMKLPVKVFYGTNWSKFKNESHDLFADFKHRFADGGTLQAGARYSRREAAFNYGFPSSAVNSSGKFKAIAIGRRNKQNAFAADVNYSRPFSTFNGTSEFVAGADFKYFTSDTKTNRGRLSPLPLDADGLNHFPEVNMLDKAKAGSRGYSDSRETLREAGVYGKLTFRPIQPLALIAGGRVSSWKIASEDNLAHKTQNRSGTAFTGYGGIVYDISDNHSLYASYSSLNRPQTAVDKNGEFLKPRRGEQFEAGIKSSYFGDRLNTRASVFRLTDKNASAPTPSGDTAAIGKRRMSGVELEVSGEILPNWNISAGYSYLDTKILRAGQKRDDAVFLLMPKNTVNLWTAYNINDQWTVGGGINGMSGFESNFGIKAGGYATADFMAKYQPVKNFSVQLNLNNLFDRGYYARVGSPGTFNMPGERRSASLTFKYQF